MTKWYALAGIVGLTITGAGANWLDAPMWFFPAIGALAAYFVVLVGRKREKG